MLTRKIGLIGNPMMYRELPLMDSIKRTLAAGFDTLELWRPQLSEISTSEEKRMLSKRIRDLGSQAIRLNCADCSYFQDLSGDRHIVMALDGLKRDIDAAADLGMSQLLTWEGRRPPNASEDEINGPIFERTYTLFHQACAYGRSSGISLSVEVHPFTLGVDVDWLCRLCDTLDKNDFCVTYDCSHFGVGLPNGYINAIDQLGHRIGHVHFSDSDKVSSEVHFTIGRGCLDLDGIVMALYRNAYAGSLMLDTWLNPNPENATRIGVPYLLDVMRRLHIAP